MVNKLKLIQWKKIYSTISSILFIFLVEIFLYGVLKKVGLDQYWPGLPIVTFILGSILSKHVKIIRAVMGSLAIDSLFSSILLWIGIQNELTANFLEDHIDSIPILIIINLFICLYSNQRSDSNKTEKQSESNSIQLFNLFYLNTSKAHEIAMLIDNKIMKTIEREQISEELLKYDASSTLGLKNALTTNMGYSAENNSKKRVYENFDVKITKSIMLRTIYQAAKSGNGNNQTCPFRVGDLVLLNDIELNQNNFDDTVMVLNILRDSKIKNQENDAIEINVNKMMDKMLDDFTIDYTFEYPSESKESERKSFIIQIPYKATDNFENGYQHNDLQLGKLSLIGIYRGEINFSDRENISSRFLEIVSGSYNQKSNNKTKFTKIKTSSSNTTHNEVPFEFHPNKSMGKKHLIDVIAIIQELNLDKGN